MSQISVVLSCCLSVNSEKCFKWYTCWFNLKCILIKFTCLFIHLWDEWNDTSLGKWYQSLGDHECISFCSLQSPVFRDHITMCTVKRFYTTTLRKKYTDQESDNMEVIQEPHEIMRVRIRKWWSKFMRKTYKFPGYCSETNLK